jgi:flavin reductase ActVB
MPREVFVSDKDAGDRFRQAMSLFPSGVAIVTTSDEECSWWGFTATSFCSLSLHPPLVLVCLATDAQCHPAFSAADSWAVNILPADQSDLALWFATKGVDKFTRGEFVANRHGDPVLTGARPLLSS